MALGGWRACLRWDFSTYSPFALILALMIAAALGLLASLRAASLAFLAQTRSVVLTFSFVTRFVASLTLPILPAPKVFCNCQSPIILLPFSFGRLLPDSCAFLLTTLDASVATAGGRTSSLIVGSCGWDEGNDPGGSVW